MKEAVDVVVVLKKIMYQRDMEEDIRKKGMLYVQQQRFGKKWRKVWSILYRESSCSISRLEFFECKDGTLEKSKCKQDTKKIIRLSDCVRVSEAADMDGCPKDCKAFLIETTEKTFLFAVEMVEVEDWMQKLCEIAFPMNWSERGAMRRNSLPPEPDDVSMTDNSLYCGKEAALRDFKVVIRRTDAAERCGLKGHYLLRTDFESLLLKEPKTGEVYFTWPYRFLRRFGRDKTTFSFEAGRRCDSGEGNFEFDTKQGNAIFQSVEASINLQKAGIAQQQSSNGARDRDTLPMPPKITPPTEDSSSTIYSMLSETAVKDKARQSPPHRTRLEAPTDKHLTGVKSLNIETRPLPRKNQVKNFRSCPLANTEDEAYSQVTAPLSDKEIPDRVVHEEQHQMLRPCSSSPDTEYSLPFDSIAKNIMMDILASSHLGPPKVVEPCLSDETRADNEKTAEPLYDSIDESAIRSIPQKPKRHSNKYPVEHIYDEPEGCAAMPPAALYDDPKEVRGNAWKTLGAVNDPSGHEFPYNAHVDDYAVPKPPRRARIPEQERERGEKSRRTGIQAEDEEDTSPYDNVIMKMKTSSLNE
ncbi:docking protein 2 [Tachysurus fulvidraco]|uniref:docking protein 2 n=1 Tax=Tachysurus fulvidraco TaxID=1234273 RepID=UPI001FEF9AF3|nr:docking protein 2 [Tachysurus fulvidraco]